MDYMEKIILVFAIAGGVAATIGLYTDSSRNFSLEPETQTRQVETLREGDVVNFNNNQYILSEDDSHKPVLRRQYEGLELKAEEE